MADISPPAPITWRTERRRIGDLVEWEDNPRRLTHDQALQLAESIRKFGYVDPVVVNADGKSIIGGHQRRRVMLAKDYVSEDTTVDVRIPSRQLTPHEQKELAIRLNRNTGEWNWDTLANRFETEELLEWGFTMTDFALKEHGDPPPPELSVANTVTCPNCGAVIKAV